MLSKLELKILKSLEKDKEYTPVEAEAQSGLPKDAIVKGVYLLHDRGFAEIREEKREKYEVTEEGKMYLAKGFPEELVFDYLLNYGESAIQELKKKFPKKTLEIGLGWLRRKGVIEITDGIVRPVHELEMPEKEVLLKISRNEGDLTPEEREIAITLVKRGLVRDEEESRLYFTLRKTLEEDVENLIDELTPAILLTGKWKDKEFLKYDVTVPAKDIFGGKIHPYQRIIKDVRKIFLEMGFTEIKGEFIQTSFWNFDALFQPQDHPARDMQDTFYLKRRVEDIPQDLIEKIQAVHETGGETGSTGWGGKWDPEKARQLVLRTHTTALTIHYLALHPEPPVKAFCIDRVYRREAIDATHLPEFDQLEGVVMDRNVGFVHLLGCLREFYIRMGFEDVRFRPGFFPYTEPSVESEVYIPDMGWIELGGAGVFRKEVTEPLGIKHKVLAWGLGIGRLAMLKLGLKDLRKLYQVDVSWLRRVPVCQW
jgi:phenylalanyl-tRNA synthetase alpha chain